MKKFFFFGLVLSFVTISSQTTRINFSKEFTYKFVSDDITDEIADFKTLGNTTGEFYTYSSLKGVPFSVFTDKLGTTPTSISFSNRLVPSLFHFYFWGVRNVTNDKPSKIETKNLNQKQVLMGISCNTYSISEQEEGYVEDIIKICVDEKNSFNNVPVLLGLSNLVRGRKAPENLTLKGLVLKVESYRNSDGVVLSSIKDTREFVNFNHSAAIAKMKIQLDSISVAQQKKLEQYEKDAEFDTEAATVDSAYAILDSAAIAEYAASDYASFDGHDIQDYISTYKKALKDEPSLAITNLPSEKLWAGLPKHCRNFEKDLPALENREFVKHLSNYTGQMCDLYLSQIAENHVDVKGTIDEIRAEVLYINDNKPKLTKSDQRKVDRYLNKLD